LHQQRAQKSVGWVLPTKKATSDERGGRKSSKLEKKKSKMPKSKKKLVPTLLKRAKTKEKES